MVIGENCNYQVFDLKTCKAPRFKFETLAEVVSVQTNPPQLEVELLFPAAAKFSDWITEDFFAGGFLETGSGTSFSVRTIMSSVEESPGVLTLELNALLNAAVGQRVTLVAGCDGSAETCESKFNNLVNGGMFVAVPEKNLSLTAIEAVTSQGGKK